MNSKERVKAIIARKKFDRCPYSFDLTYAIVKKIADRMNVQPHQVSEAIRDDLWYVGAGYPKGFVPREAEKDQAVDEFGVIWDRSQRAKEAGDWGEIIYSPLSEPTLKGYDFPKGSASGRFDYMKEKSQDFENAERYVILGMDGIFDKGWHLRGFENMLMDFATEENFVNELFDKALEFNLGVIEQIPDFVDGIRFGEDWGQQKGLLMGAKYWRKYLKNRRI